MFSMFSIQNILMFVNLEVPITGRKRCHHKVSFNAARQPPRPPFCGEVPVKATGK